MEERLQNILARAGFDSRRACEELIRQGRVAVDGRMAQLGQKADLDRDPFTVDGPPIQVRHSPHRLTHPCYEHEKEYRALDKTSLPIPANKVYNTVRRLTFHASRFTSDRSGRLTHQRYPCQLTYT